MAGGIFRDCLDLRCSRSNRIITLLLRCAPGMVICAPQQRTLCSAFKSSASHQHVLYSAQRESLSKNWSRIKSRAKKFFTGKWSPADETARPQRKKTKKNENSTAKLNNELNTHTDWDAIRKDLKDQGISINNLSHIQ